MEKEKEEIYHFLYKEWSKLHDQLYAYDKFFKNIEIKSNRYNFGFQLILDSLTRSIATTIDLFFQKRKDCWSLYTIDAEGVCKVDIDNAKKEIKFCIILRNHHIGHLPKNIIQEGNYRFFNQAAINKIREVWESVGDILYAIGKTKEGGHVYTKGFVGIEDGVDYLIDDLKK